MIHSCVFCLVIVVHESLVCPEQLNCLLFFRKILQLPQIIWFSSIFVYLNPFQQWLYDFEIHLFTPRTTEGLICNYYRRFKHSLMLQKEKTCIKSWGVKTFERNEDIFLVLPKYHIFLFSTAHQRLQKIVTCFPEDKLSWVYPDLQILALYMRDIKQQGQQLKCNASINNDLFIDLFIILIDFYLLIIYIMVHFWQICVKKYWQQSI